MLRPVIFIGCGGSGEKAVRYVRDAVRRRLEHAGWEREMPDAWQFIGLDTLTTQESPTEIPTIPAQDFLTLSAEHDSYDALHRSLLASHNAEQGHPDLFCGWLPQPGQARIPLKDGAGQNRAIGRASGLRSLERVLLPRLKVAFERSKSGNQVLYEVGQRLGVQAELGSNTPGPLVVVCSSMAGGTGAGVALDVIDLVRRCDSQGAHPTLVLFANDIFDLAGDSDAMAANSLGLMSELLAAYWSEHGEIDSPLSSGNVQTPGVGPHSVFIVSKYGYSGADLGNTVEVYQAAGEALATWVTSDIVQEQIHTFINVNWRNSAGVNLGGYPFGERYQFGAVSSFGAAKVTVGRDRFSHWAEDKLGRAVLEQLLQGHLRFGNKEHSETEEELVKRLANNHAERVHKAWQFGAGADDAILGCVGASDHFAPADEVRAIAAEVEKKLQQPAEQQASGKQWYDRLKSIGRDQTDFVERQVNAAQDSKWYQDMVDATCKAASEVAAVSSLAVAAAALEAAAKELNPVEINRVRQTASSAESKYEESAARGLASIEAASGQISGSDQRLRDAVSQIARGVAYRWQSLRLNAAADVMQSAADEVLVVMANALRGAAKQVEIALGDDEVQVWPKDGSGVSQRYLPSQVEFPLESHGDWEQMLADLCAEASNKNVSYGSKHTDPVRYRLVAGTPLSAAEEHILPLVYPSSTGQWIPGHSANLVCKANKEDIQERVRQWTRASGGRFQRFVGEGLAGYLQETDPSTEERRVDHADRLEQFRFQLGAAKTRAQPLVSIDQDLYAEIFRAEMGLLTVCSPFPFPEGHPAAKDAEKIIGEDDYTTGNQDTASVLVSQYIKTPLHPLAVRSFTRPVIDALSEHATSERREGHFWRWRRGRRLDAFVPMPREVLKATIRGFAVARLCGYITAAIDRQVLITAAPDVAEFPWPLLSGLKDPNDVLANLLEGFSLTFGMVSRDGFAAYEPYRRLHDLGESLGNGRQQPDLAKVISTGSPIYPTVADESPKASGETQEQRLDSARRYLADNIAWFEEQKTKRSKELACRGTDGIADAGVPTMELAELYIECYSELREQQLHGEQQTGSLV